MIAFLRRNWIPLLILVGLAFVWRAEIAALDTQRDALVASCERTNKLRALTNQSNDVTVHHNDVTAQKFRELAVATENAGGDKEMIAVMESAAREYDKIKKLYVNIGLVDCEQVVPKV